MAEQKSENKGFKIFILIFILLFIAVAVFFFFRKTVEAPSSEAEIDKINVKDNFVPAGDTVNKVDDSKPIVSPNVVAVPSDDPLKKYDKTYISYVSGDGKIRGTAGINYLSYGDKHLDVIFNIYVEELPPKDGDFAGKILGLDGLEVKGSLISGRYCGYDHIAYPFGVYYEDVYKCGGGIAKTYYVTADYKTNNYDDLLKFNSLEIWKNSEAKFDYNLDKLFEKGKKIASYSFVVSKAPLKYENR